LGFHGHGPRFGTFIDHGKVIRPKITNGSFGQDIMVLSWPLKYSNLWISFNGHEYVIQFIAIKHYLFNGHEYAAFNGHEYVAKFMAIQMTCLMAMGM
jgi:hypothetical protein